MSTALSGAPQNVQKAASGLVNTRRVLDHIVGNAGQFRNFGRNRPSGVHKGIKPVNNLPIHNLHSADFGHGVFAGGEAGGLNIKRNERPYQR